MSRVLRGEEGSATTFAAANYYTSGGDEEEYDACYCDAYFSAESKGS